MVIQLVKYFLSFLVTMASGPLVLILANLAWEAQINRFIAEHPIGVCAVIASYMFFVCMMFFRLQSVFMVFHPEPGSVPVPKEELLSRLERAFGTRIGDRALFDFMRSKDKAVITWAASISYFQGVSGGASGLKRVVVLRFNEHHHNVFFIMKNKDWKWNLSQNFAEFSLNYNIGLSAEMRTEVYPSIEFGPEGIRVDMKRLSYSSEELWQPIQSAVLSSGWTLRGGMLPYFRQQLVFCSTLCLLMFLLLSGIVGLFHKPAAPAAPPGVTSTPKVSPEVSQGKQPTPQENMALLEKAAATMATDRLRSMIEAHMKIPAQYLQGEQATVLSIYARAYLTRRDRDEGFAKALLRFAGERSLDLQMEQGIKE